MTSPCSSATSFAAGAAGRGPNGSETTSPTRHLERSVAECHGRWGIWGFSVLEVPDGDYKLLARLRPIVTQRRLLLVADGHDLVTSGFPLLPTLDFPHWTVQLSEPTPAQFARVRAHFRGPQPNPAWAGTEGRIR